MAIRLDLVSCSVAPVALHEAVNAIKDATGLTVSAILAALHAGVIYTVGEHAYVL